MKTHLPLQLMLGLLTVISLQSSAQSPGNVDTTNLTAWFNPNNMPLGNATSWTTVYPSGVSAITLVDGAAPYAQVNDTSSFANYNKVIDFNGNLATAAGSMALEKTGTLNLLNNNVTTAQARFIQFITSPMLLPTSI